NQNTCPVCLAMPGALPVLNEMAVEKCIMAGLATECRIAEKAVMDRKNYFYPDLPKAYQISQLYHPLCKEGSVAFDYVDSNGNTQHSIVRIERIHLEEDAGKSLHDAYDQSTLLDFNRCGVPLIEVVTYPDMTSAEEAGAFVETLSSILRFAGVSDCKMQEGSLRADVNLSLKKSGTSALGTRTETKNLNSIRAIIRAAKSEVKRQSKVLSLGNEIVQETKRWDDAKGVSYSMRSKEESNDYRYFPDPDLVPIHVTGKWKENIQSRLPELPSVKISRYVNDYKLPEYDARILTSEPSIAMFFEKCIQYTDNIKQVSNYIMGDMLRIIKEREIEFDAVTILPEHLAQLIGAVGNGEINSSTAKTTVLEAMFDIGSNPAAIINEKGLAQVSDDGVIRDVIKEVIVQNPDPVAQYRQGKKQVLGYLMGQIMKKTRGKANPDSAMTILKEELHR
ncbi:MAG: Asp-tRNA(Asn)/Glu-tRNA(Gln) amidotransferase subunit GatB, partial [Clostridiales bacterium]|nr:Asp-tRNA(Asn)/Glu-tRNA(Gln) amidotransferase subunit GatB [Clostridiales bacterium]